MLSRRPDPLPPGLQRLVAIRHDKDVRRVVADCRQAEQLVIVCTERRQIAVRLAEHHRFPSPYGRRSASGGRA